LLFGPGESVRELYSEVNNYYRFSTVGEFYLLKNLLKRGYGKERVKPTKEVGSEVGITPN